MCVYLTLVYNMIMAIENVQLQGTAKTSLGKIYLPGIMRLLKKIQAVLYVLYMRAEKVFMTH